MKIDIQKVCGTDVISREAGKKIRDLMIANWGKKEIIVDFNQQRISSVSFFDEAFALLINKENKTLEEIKEKIKFERLREEDRLLLNYIINKRIKS